MRVNEVFFKYVISLVMVSNFEKLEKRPSRQDKE